MTEDELQKYLREHYPSEDATCEWKEFTRLKHAFSGKKGRDIISYVSGIANMDGGHLIIGVEDKTLAIIGIKDTHNFMPGRPYLSHFRQVSQSALCGVKCKRIYYRRHQ